MTPLQFAKRECANIRPDGSCLGIMVNDLHWRGQKILATERKVCLLGGSKPKRCGYFEKVVLPLADRPTKDQPRLQQQRLEARAKYGLINDVETKSVELRTCPDCGTEPLSKRQRVCPKCQQKRRRESARVHIRQKRGMPVDS